MTPFERQLKQALERKEPSPDFTSKVLAAANQQPTQAAAIKSQRWTRWFYRWSLVPAFAALLLMAAGAVHWQRERVARGEQARDKLLLAMRIAGSRLNDARQRVVKIDSAKEEQ